MMTKNSIIQSRKENNNCKLTFDKLKMNPTESA